MATDPRRAAVTALSRVHRDGSYSNIVLDTLLQETAFDARDKALLSRLVYGVIERQLTLDFVIEKLAARAIGRIHPTVLEILRVALYQLLYMDKIPPNAAVNEAVRLTRSMGQPHAAGFVNALLRSALRQRETLFADLPTGDAGDAVRFGVPEHWIAYWRETYGKETSDALLTALSTSAPQYLRVNTLKTDTESFLSALDAAGIAHETVSGLPDCVRISAGFDRKGLAKAGENWYYYQDAASQYCCRALGARPGETIADVCAAPGGKSFTVAQMMQNRGHLLSCDLYSQKCETIARRAKTLGITCIETRVRDAVQPIPQSLEKRFDRVLCDAPCSGLGVIRHKPEIRYRTRESVEALPALQLDILCRTADMVKPGGVLQYSTCTLRREENEAVAAAFLEKRPDFAPRVLPLDDCFAKAGLSPSHCLTLFPHVHDTDGFFIAGFVRRESDET